VAGRRAANVAQARRESDQYQDWLALELSKLGEEDALQAWDPPPPEKVPPDLGWRPSWSSQPWGGLTDQRIRNKKA
jgi:hypothetical protein